jgi:hypothetical protein
MRACWRWAFTVLTLVFVVVAFGVAAEAGPATSMGAVSMLAAIRPAAIFFNIVIFSSVWATGVADRAGTLHRRD